jgi:hypothetical protein
LPYLPLVLLATISVARAAAPVTESVHCSLNYSAAEACQMSDQVASDGLHTMEFVFGSNRVRFTGNSQGGWWSGQLDGQPAMGFELNRGHLLFSTSDLKTTFEWWSNGNEHGTY